MCRAGEALECNRIYELKHLVMLYLRNRAESAIEAK